MEWGPWRLWSQAHDNVPPTPPKNKPPRDLVVASVDGCWLTWYGPDPGEGPYRREDGERRPVVAVYVRSPVPPTRPLS